MEIWDIYDVHRIKKDKTILRGEPLSDGDYHLAVHICIFNSDGEMLIQQRQPFKEDWPDMWDITVGGCAVSGETSQKAAERELFEEIGLKVDLENVRPHLTINFASGFNDIYLIENNADISALALQDEEVQRVRWAPLKEIFSLIDCNKFIPYHKSLIQLFFDMRLKYGAHNIK